jgi:hypothetical protein
MIHVTTTSNFRARLGAGDLDRLRALEGMAYAYGYASSRRGPFTMRITRSIDGKVTGTVVGCGATPQEAIERAIAREGTR